jgi:peptide/nickel transport system substrate-binding protein
LELVRNPEFREWSRAAQPDGFPDRLIFVTGLSATEATAQVADGRADAVWEGVPSHRADRLRELHPGQVHSNAGTFMFYVFLNTTVPPFDNVDARRAVAFAMDRRSFAHDPQGFVGDGQVTCQVLPPYLQGFDPYCPYTLGGDASGAWSSPDLGRAMRLVQASGTAGDRVTVPVMDQLRGPARHLAQLLTVLGYRASLREVSNSSYFDYISRRSHRVQAGVSGWGPDYPSMTSFLPPLARCDFAVAFNLSFFCDRGIDNEITVALAEQTTDPGAAAAAWRTIDHALVDQAPIVPFAFERRHDFVSRRAGNFTYHPLYHLLPAQLWVQ